jgi:hypothetical protein
MWNKLSLRCDICCKPYTIMDMAFNGKGEIQLFMVCIVCGKDRLFETDIFRMTAFAIKKEGVTTIEGNETIH